MALLCPFLGVACLWDYSYRRIPNFLQLLLWGVGLIFSFWNEAWRGLIAYNLTSLVVMISFYPFFVFGLLGAGDIKIIGLSAGFFRGVDIPAFLLITFLLAAVFGIIKWLYMRKRGKRERVRKEVVIMSGPILISALLHWGGVY